MSLTAHFAQLLEDNSFGIRNDDIFLYQLPLGEKYTSDKSVYSIIPIGGTQVQKGITTQDFEIVYRACNGEWSLGEEVLYNILQFIQTCGLCQLPVTVKNCCGVKIGHYYKILGIRTINGVTSLGTDSENNMLFTIRFSLSYERE